MEEQEYKLEDSIKCPICKADYNRSQAVVLKEDNSQTILHITCGKCGTAVLSFISNGAQGVVSMNLATDLNKQESRVLFNGNSIQFDNVLEVYEKLKQI